MEIVILSIHLLVCICLIGLVLLQRSEGGALGMGGGGGGALMSGRGASDALARLTSIAGAFFLATSLGLTWLSQAGQPASDTSVFDNLIPQQSAPAAPAPAPAEEPASTTPDPTQSSAPQAAETQLAAISLGPGDAAAATPPPAAAPPATTSAARAAPLEQRPAPTAAAANRTAGATSQPVSTGTTVARTQPPATQRSATATVQPAATNPAPQRQAPPAAAPAEDNGAVSGLTLTEPATPESVEVGNGLEAVRRTQRAGPDQ